MDDVTNKATPTRQELIDQMLECELGANDIEITQKESCGICVTEFLEGEKVKITSCNHTFH